MLNNNKERELCYVVTIDDIRPIPNYDRVEHARVGGWWVIVRKNQFHIGDPAIYFEIDSKVPNKEPFLFLENKHFKIKTQKMCKVLSQGLLMAAEDFGWEIGFTQFAGDIAYIKDDKGVQHIAGDVEGGSMFLTKQLNVTYSVVEDNARKANSYDKYKKMAQRNGKLFSHQPFRWLMKREWGKKLLFVFFGRKKDKKSGWPVWVSKTDEERVQNMPWILENKDPWIATEKIDGTSTTFTLYQHPFKDEFYVCSRNVVFDTPDKNCYYDTNVYLEMAEKYNIKQVLKDLLSVTNAQWVTIQGETYGDKIQKRDYGLKNDAHDFMAFNLIFSDRGRVSTLEMRALLEAYGVPCVPVVDASFVLPDTVEELLDYATDKSMVDGGMREGIVFRSQDGSQSFKAVSNEFLLKYHQ